MEGHEIARARENWSGGYCTNWHLRQSAGLHIVYFDGANPVRGRCCKRLAANPVPHNVLRNRRGHLKEKIILNRMSTLAQAHNNQRARRIHLWESSCAVRPRVSQLKEEVMSKMIFVNL